MVVGEASIHNIMGGMESTGGVRLHNHKRKLKQRFDIIKKLGQGTYGKVQLGINKETGQEVAIKTIKKCKIETEADLIRIRREIQIMSSVQHPNIIHIYEVFENREKMVLVMEYAAGGELYDYLSERKVLAEQEARRIFRQISTAVYYCHKHKICHRDLKLENILLDQNGNAKIADFGLSNVFDEQRLLSTFCGSPLYASPEIVKGTPYHGPEVDCWSLGVLLYTLVYGAMPFDGSNFKRLVKQISTSDYFEPKKPSPASPLIKEMLMVCPSRRADIEKICTHWWVNESYEQNCLDIAEELAAQTPVRLDLLLSLVPQSASAEKLVVGEQQPPPADIANSMSSETLVPTRCHSVGSLMEIDQNNSDRRIREMVQEEEQSKAAAAVSAALNGSDAKRKLETTPSTDETTAAGVKRKESRARRKDGSDDRDPRAYRSVSKHHSAPIPSSIIEEAMEIDPAVVSVPTCKTVDESKVGDSTSQLEVSEKEHQEKSPSNERSQLPITPDQARSLNEDSVTDQPAEEKPEEISSTPSRKSSEQELTKKEPAPMSPEKVVTQLGDGDEKKDTLKSDVPKEKSIATADEAISNKVPVQKENRKSIDPEKQQPKEHKMKSRALSLDSELLAEESAPKPSTERRRSKIFETAEKFNQLASPVEPEKPKKIFIPGVNVGGAKLAFERKASLSSATLPQVIKAAPVTKVIIDVPLPDKKLENEKPTEADKEKDEKKREEDKKRAIDIITGALGKPPVQKKSNGSPPISPQSNDSKKLGLKIPVGPNDVRNATVTVSTPTDTKFPFESKPELQAKAVPVSSDASNNDAPTSSMDEPKKCSKMEITLKSATLPRQRKTSKAEITLSGARPVDTAFRSEVEAKIDAFHPQKLRTQRSEVAFPVAAAVPQAHRSSSLEPDGQKGSFKERIIPIQVESMAQQATVHSTTPPPKPPVPQRSLSQRSGSLSRQSTADSDTDSALGSTAGPEPIRKSPREYIIPIAVEGGGYVTPRSGSVEPESKNSTPTSTNPPRSRFSRPRRMGSLLSDASEDESPFSSLHRDNDDLLQRHMHRLRSSRPTRQAPEHADSLSSGEDDDEDGFELLTAENLFSTLLSRVRSLTQRLNVDDNRSSGFPSSRLLGRLGSNSPQSFYRMHEPLSRINSEFRRSMSRDNSDRFSRKDSSVPNSPGSQQNSPGARTLSRDSLFDIGNNTLPRAKKRQSSEQMPATSPSTPTYDVSQQQLTSPSNSNGLSLPEAAEQLRKEAQESLEQSFTPCLARRLSRQFIEQTRQMLPRSPSLPRERTFRCSSPNSNDSPCSLGGVPGGPERFRSRSHERACTPGSMRRSNSLLEQRNNSHERRSPRRSISLFDDEDRYLPVHVPRQPIIGSLGRKYRDSGKLSTTPIAVEKIQEEQPEDVQQQPYQQNQQPSLTVPRIIKTATDDSCNSFTENNSLSECPSLSVSNCLETTSSRSAISGESTPTESTSNILDYGYKSSSSNAANITASSSTKDLQNRLLAAENLIKESKLKNLGLSKYNPNLSSNYKELDKCDKESLGALSETASAAIAKRRSCIPSLRLRSGSLTRDSSLSRERGKAFMGSEDTISVHALTPERSLLSKFFRSSSSRDVDVKDKSEIPPKPKQRRISRFLRPDFFDTPREESQYVKEKEAQKAAENERRKSRFMRRRSESKSRLTKPDDKLEEEKLDKELKNEVNSLTKGRSETPTREQKVDKNHVDDAEPKTISEKPSIRNSFLQTLEKKLEKFRSNDESSFKSSNKTPVALDDNKTQYVKCEKPKENENLISAIESSSPLAELAPIEKAASVEDLLTMTNSGVPTQTPARTSKVNTVLGLFKNIEPKTVDQNGASRSQGQTILGRLRKNTYKGSRSDNVLTADASGSKIPTKLSKAENGKSDKKIAGPKISPEKSTLGFKRSPSKDKEKDESTPPKRVSPETKKPAMERLSKTLKKSPEKLLKGKTEKPEKPAEMKKDSSVSRIMEKKRSPEKSTSKKSLSPEKALAKAKSPERILDNKHVEGMNGDGEEKAVTKLKKKIISSSATMENQPEAVKKVKKVIKSKEPTDKDKDGAESTKKKKIVRVVKKVVKKSTDSSDSKSEDKPPKNVLKNLMVLKKDKSPEASLSSVDNQRKSPETQIPAQTKEAPETNVKTDLNESKASQNLVNNKEETIIVVDKDSSSDYTVESQAAKTAINVDQSKAVETKPNREKLKLDFSKIPTHNFRNITPPRRESPKSETPKNEVSENSKIFQRSHSDEVSGKLMDLSKFSHRASFTGNRIFIDKTSRAKDSTEFDTDTQSSTATISSKENLIGNIERISNDIPKEINVKSNSKISPLEKNNIEEMRERKISKSSSKEPLSTEDLMSPTEDTESFDSWSICSADINLTRGDLHSPTSPTYSMYMRGDNPHGESVIDRIRRKSFYCRFNDRKRKASLNAPPPGVNMSSSMTLPRKFSFSSSREENKNPKMKVNNYTLPSRKNSDKCYSMYNDDASVLRKSPIERDRYSDGGSVSAYSNDLKSPVSDSCAHISSSYDPLRKYLSPTFDSSPTRRKYHSTELNTDNDLSTYRNSSLTDSILEPTLSRNLSTLPRRYGSSMSGFEPKTVEYYEELLTPNHTDYFRARRASPLPHEYSKYENGYHNGSLDLPQFNAEKWKSRSNNTSKSDLNEGPQAEPRSRKVSQCISEPDDLSSHSLLEQRATTSTAERCALENCYLKTEQFQ